MRLQAVLNPIYRVVLCGVFLYVGVAAYDELNFQKMLQSPADPAAKPVIYNGLEFNSTRDRNILLAEERRDSLYPWAKPLMEWQALILLSAATGLFGGLARDARNYMARQRGSPKPHYLFGLIMGPALLAVSALYPALMIEGDLNFRLPAVAGVCFLGGAFSQQAWRFLNHLAIKTFEGDKKP